MGVILGQTLRIGATGFVGQKALRCFGKKDYADVISFVTWCLVGVQLVILVSGAIGWSTEWMNSAKETFNAAKSSPIGEFVKGFLQGLGF
ncbi:MAG: hypothetical protein ACRCX8_18575 [Sarcina sp.]